MARKTVSIGNKNYKANSPRAKAAVAAGGTVSRDKAQIRSNADASKARSAALEAADPLSQAQNAGIKVPERIEADEMPGVVADLAKKGIVPTQVTNKAQVQPPTAQNQPQDVISGTTPPTGTQGQPNPYQQAFEASKGTAAPPDAGAARGAVNAAVQPYRPEVSSPGVEGLYADGSDPITAIVQNAYQNYLTSTSQKDSLLGDYKKLYKQSGLDDINEELIDAESILDGTEQDIRNEIQSAGGFGTESQIQAMTLSRNKGLLKRYNQLFAAKQDATQQLNMMLNLSAQDRQMAQQRADSQLNVAFKLAEFKSQAQNAVKEQYRWLTTQMGADGIYNAYKNDPQQLAYLEKTLGVAPGGMATLASQAAQSRALETQMKQAQLAAQYSSIETDKLQQAKLRMDMAPASTEFASAQAQSNIQNISNLANDASLGGAVGPNFLSRLDPFSFFTGKKQNFIGGVEQLREQLTLDKLGQAKQNGATFGALSDGERVTVAAAATKLGSWAQKDKDGKVVGYNVDEKSFKQELDKINNFAKLDAIIKGTDPASIGVQQTADGAYWTKNSDGSMTRLR